MWKISTCWLARCGPVVAYYSGIADCSGSVNYSRAGDSSYDARRPMPRKELSGTLDEQSQFLYDLAQQKIRDGNFTGAAHALQEIVEHNPGFRNAAELLATVKNRKAEQRALLIYSLLGFALFIGVGTLLGIANDLILLALAVVGTAVGYGTANLIRSYRR